MPRMLIRTSCTQATSQYVTLYDIQRSCIRLVVSVGCTGVTLYVEPIYFLGSDLGSRRSSDVIFHFTPDQTPDSLLSCIELNAALMGKINSSGRLQVTFARGTQREAVGPLVISLRSATRLLVAGVDLPGGREGKP